MNPRLFVLMGPSGVGKTTILRYLQDKASVDSAPKYTTRASRHTADDARDFIFCEEAAFPARDLLRFESYGHLFAIQLNAIDASLAAGKSHATVVGDGAAVKKLVESYPRAAVPIFVFCESETLQERMRADQTSHRADRWPQILNELQTIYDQLADIEFLINNGRSSGETFKQVDRLLARIKNE